MQQSVLSRPAALPTEPHFEPPHLVHARGQQALPLSFSPSKPGNPLLHSETGSVVVLWWNSRRRREKERPQAFCDVRYTPYPTMIRSFGLLGQA